MKPIMYLLRGMPGAGKSTLIDKHKLKSNTISLDTFREMYSGLSMGINGEEGIDQKHNEYVMTPFWDAMRFRMKERATIIVDNLNLRARDINSFVKIADGYDYEVKVVNFPLENLEFYLERNKNREERKRLPEFRLADIHQIFQEIDLSEVKAKFISLDDFETTMSSTNEDKAVSLDAYENIVVIGDIYGASDSFQKSIKYFDPKNFYIFTGAMFGDCEGAEKVLHSLLLIADLDNVLFLRSQSDHLFIYGADSSLNKSEVIDYQRVFDKSVPYFMFSYDSQHYFVSHAGVSKIPRNPELFNASLFTKKQDIENIDQCFEINDDSEWFQIHGSVLASPTKEQKTKSFSVYERVDLGGKLVVLKIFKGGRTIDTTRNHQVSSNILDKHYKTTFKGFKKTSEIDLTKINKIGSQKELTIYSDSTNTYFTYHNDIVFIENKNSMKINVTFEEVEILSLSYSVTHDDFILFNKDGAKKDFNTELFNQKYLDLAEQNDCILDVVSFEGVFYVVGGTKKDKERNRLKNKFFNESPIKMVSFENEKAFKGFKKGMKKSNKPFFII